MRDKTKFATALLAVLLMVMVARAGAPSARPVHFLWEHDSATNGDTFILYETTNVAGPYYPRATFDGTTRDGYITNFPGIYFYVLTVSNSYWAIESSFSNRTNAPLWSGQPPQNNRIVPTNMPPVP